MFQYTGGLCLKILYIYISFLKPVQMSVNKPNFTLPAQGDRRTEDVQKELLQRTPKQTHIAVSAASLNIAHSATTYQVCYGTSYFRRLKGSPSF